MRGSGAAASAGSMRGLARYGLDALVVLGALALGTLGVPDPARAVLLAAGDGTENTTAPADDPGFANVGNRGGLSAVYIGNGWVLTASHVGVGPVVFGSNTYEPSPGGGFAFATTPGVSADLIVFKLKKNPPLPALTISSETPPPGAEVTLVGNGLNRGAATSWNGISGWLWGTGSATRWGTNLVVSAPLDVTVGNIVTQAFYTDFTQPPPPPSEATAYESQGVPGDSGGAVFYKNGSSWELAGILFGIDSFVNQPAGTALYGNKTYAVDLAFYRTAILGFASKPACSDGIDDDGDGFIDFPADPGCYTATSGTESPACQDGIDNDGDGGIDYDGGASANHGVPLGPPDPQCDVPYRNSETPSACGLGAELAAVLPLLQRLRRSRRLRGNARV